MLNCLVTGNSTIVNCLCGFAEGGGIAILGDEGTAAPVAEIINSTISGNTAYRGGGGIKLLFGGTPAVPSKLRNSIVWGNTSTTNGYEIDVKDGGALEVDYSDVRGRTNSTYVSGAGQITWVEVSGQQTNIGETITGTPNHDPNFVGGGDYHLDCPTPCANVGNLNSSIIPQNEFSLGTAASTDPTPDLDLATRVQNLRVDMGAYEKTLSACPRDFNGDGGVGVPDLLLVINSWGPCGSPCPTDTAPNGGDGEVGVPDLLAVINAWGPCPCRTTASDSIPQVVTDCMEICENEPDYGACVTKCLCAIGYYNEECD